MDTVKIGPHEINGTSPVFVVAEIGINHQGDVRIAKQLIDAAVSAGCQMVKLQKRTPELCVPKDQRDVERDTIWGRMSYIDYRERIEFGLKEYSEIAKHCEAQDVMWTASAWDVPSVEFLNAMGVPCHKVPSAMLTNHDLLRAMRKSGKPIIISTGMSTTCQIEEAIRMAYDGLPHHQVVLMHCTSTYPCVPEELNLRCIQWLQSEYPAIPIGYSGHETGIPPTLAAVALGAKVVERHITLNRAMIGSDHAASLEPVGLQMLVRQIRAIERSLGDGVKRVYDSELPIMAKLRG